LAYINSIITGTGSAIPANRVPNSAFLNNKFIGKDGKPVTKNPQQVIDKLEQISGIRERKYIGDDQDTAALGARAGERAIEDAGINKENIDGIIVAHNFGNIQPGDHQGQMIPNLAAVVKHRLGIHNHKCFAYDVLFGCPGWLESMIIAHQYLQLGKATNLLVVGVEVISRILDPHDLDSMLFGDGAGATIVSGIKEDSKRGLLAHNTYSHCMEELDYLKMGCAVAKDGQDILSPKMNGRGVFKYGMTYLPQLITETLGDANVEIKDVSKFLFHQANEKMIMKISQQLLSQYEIDTPMEDLVPFMVQETGNSSVATIPTMIDFINHDRLLPHTINTNDNIVMTSVGAGMHCNCLIYKA